MFFDGCVGSSVQIPAVTGAGMGANTFGDSQLDEMGAVSLDEFAAFMYTSINPIFAAAERMQVSVSESLLETKSMASRTTQIQINSEQVCQIIDTRLPNKLHRCCLLTHRRGLGPVP